MVDLGCLGKLADLEHLSTGRLRYLLHYVVRVDLVMQPHAPMHGLGISNS